MIDISLQPQYIFTALGFRVSNSLLTSWIASALIIATAAAVGIRGRKDGFVMRAMRYGLYELLKISQLMVGSRRKALAVIPVVATIFIFIVTANLIELLPGFLGAFRVATQAGPVDLLRSPNSDLNTTVALALVAFFATQYFSLQNLGLGGYVKRFINFSNAAGFITGFFELLSEAVRVISFSFRLFGNIFAGEVLLVVIAFLAPYLVPVPFMILEIFVGVVQALIFSMLTLSFIRIASQKR